MKVGLLDREGRGIDRSGQPPVDEVVLLAGRPPARDLDLVDQAAIDTVVRGLLAL
ncbi:MAG: hypothetical protein ABI720_11760 [Actinomycetes bacterium]